MELPWQGLNWLNTDGEFDDEGCPFGFVVSYPDISVVIRDDGIDNGQS